MAVELVGAVLGWLTTEGGNRAVRGAVGAVLGSPQHRALRTVVETAVDQTVGDVGLVGEEAAHLRAVLLEGQIEPYARSVSSEAELRSAMRAWTRMLDEPSPDSEGYLSMLGIDPDSIADDLAERILDGINADARHGGQLASLGTWIWRDGTTELLKRTEATVAALQARGRALLEQLDRQARLAVRSYLGHRGDEGGFRLDRGAQAAGLFAAAMEAPATIVYGESGSGKSALVLEAATAAGAGPGAVRVLCLNLRQLPDSVAALVGFLGAPLDQHLRGLDPPCGLLVIDAADAVAEGQGDILVHLVDSARASNVRVVAVTSNENREVVLDIVREHTGEEAVQWLVELLSDSELQNIVSHFPKVERLARDPRSRELLRRLVVVDLLVRSEIDGTVPLSEWDAMQAVWRGLVRRGETADRGSPEARGQVLTRLAAWELAGRQPTLDPPQLDPVAVDWLRRDGLLRPADDNPWQPSPDFSHDEIRRYATARFLLSTGNVTATLKQAGPPRWALSAAMLAAQGLLSARGSDGRPQEGLLARVQVGFDALAGSGAGARWADIPTEALLGSGLPDAVLEDAWDHLASGDQAGVDRLLRVLDQRHSDGGGAVNPVVAEPVMRCLLDHPTPWTYRPASFDLLRGWLLGLVIRDTPTGDPLRQLLRDRLLAFCASGDERVAARRREEAAARAGRTADEARRDEEFEQTVREFDESQGARRDRRHVPSEVTDEKVVELLALLGPDLGQDGESVLRRIATDDPWYLAPSVEEFGTARALAAYSADLLADLTLGYYIDDEDGWHYDREGVRDHRWRGPITPLAAWYRGPFYVLFQVSPVRGAAVLNALLNHATRRRVAIQTRLDQRLGSGPAREAEEYETVLRITGSADCYAGDAAVWCWYRGTTAGPEPCTSALQAMERVCDQLVALGVPLEGVVAMLLRGCENLATLGLVVELLTRHLEKAGSLLDPFLAEPRVWEFEFNRSSHEHVTGQAAASDDVVDRRRWSLREVAYHLVLAADPERVAELRLVGERMVATAEATAAEDTANGAEEPTAAVVDASYLARVRDWASVLDRGRYRAYARDGLVYVQAEPPEEVTALLAPETHDLQRGHEVIRLQHRYFTSRHTARAEYQLPSDDELAADIDTARGLLADPPQLLPVRPIDAAAHVCLAALEAVLIRGLMLPEDRLAFAVEFVLEIAERQGPAIEYEYEESYFEQGIDRTAAKALPLLLLPQAATTRTAFGEARIEQAGLNLARAVPHETRLFLARTCDRVWASPCLGSPCCHQVALNWVTESMRDSIIGSWDPNAQQHSVIRLPDPVTSALAAAEPDSIYLARLDAAIRACGAAAVSTSCVRDAARELLDVLLVTQRGALASRRFSDRRGSHSLAAARALLGLAAAGDTSPLAAHLDAYQNHTYMLTTMLHALAAAAETPALAEAARQVWPDIIMQVLSFQEAAPNPFQEGSFGSDALAALMPLPARARTVLYSEAESLQTGWVEPLAWQTSIEAWLAAARGRPRCVDSLVAVLSTLPFPVQATVGMRWICTLVIDHAAAIAGRTRTLAGWLAEIRPTAESTGTLPEWQRIVDTLTVAGDRDLAPYSQ